MAVSSVASRLSSLRGTLTGAGVRLADCFDKPLVEDIFNCAIKRQTGVTLRHMLDFGANPVERQLLLSAQFLHQELPVRLAHRVAELENLPYGLSAKPHVLKVRALDWDHPTPRMGQAARVRSDSTSPGQLSRHGCSRRIMQYVKTHYV